MHASTRHTQLRDEQALIEHEIQALETAQDRFFEEAELLIQLANWFGDVYTEGDPSRKRALAKLVASNATLEGGKARLNLFPTTPQ